MKIIVIDDDPTGSQTVYNCPLLLSWDNDTLINGLRNSASLLFILANTRALSAELAEERINEICDSLIFALHSESISLDQVIVISRGDSTLRGHGFLEPQIIHNRLGPFDATFHIPAFLEGKRTTKDSIHYLDGTPIHKTDFAKDKIFSYNTSYLPKWLEEKSQFQIQSEDVFKLDLNILNYAIRNSDGLYKLVSILSNFSLNQHVILDVEEPIHLITFIKALHLLPESKRFLFRSAASFIGFLADLPENPKNINDLVSLKLKDDQGCYKSGLVLIGSYIPLSSRQLKYLLENDCCIGVEIMVEHVLSLLNDPNNSLNMNEYKQLLLDNIYQILHARKTPVLYTSRREFIFKNKKEKIKLSIQLAEFMSSMISELTPYLGYLISKGGITTNTLLLKGLQCKQVKLEGQIMPGLSLLTAHIKKNLQLPVVTFPGNLGDQSTLIDAFKIMDS